MKRKSIAIILSIAVILTTFSGCKVADVTSPLGDETSTETSSDKGKVEKRKIFEDNSTSFEKLFKDAPLLAWDDNQLAGYIDIHGNWVIAPKYTRAQKFDEGLAPVFDPESNKWGYINTKGEWEIEPAFSDAESFKDGMAVVSPSGVDARGLIDTKGEYLIQPIYYKISPFVEDYALVQQTYNSTCHFIDKHGKKVFDDYKDAFLFHNGKAVVRLSDDLCDSGCDWGILNHDGSLEILNLAHQMVEDEDAPPGVYLAWNLSEDAFPSSNTVGDYSKYKFGYVNLSRGYAVKLLFGDYAVINDKGEVISPTFNYLYTYGGKYAEASDWRGSGIVSTETWEWLVDPIYWEIGNYYEDYSWAVLEEDTDVDYIKDYHWFIIDMEGNVVLDLAPRGDINLLYDVYNIFPDKREIPLAASKKFSDEPFDFKRGFVDWDYNEVLPFIYDEVGGFSYDCSYSTAKYNGHWGMIDTKGNWLIEPKFLSFEEKRYD